MHHGRHDTSGGGGAWSVTASPPAPSRALAGRPLIAAMLYAFALNFKQTTLYFAPALCLTLLMLCIRVRADACARARRWIVRMRASARLRTLHARARGARRTRRP